MSDLKMTATQPVWLMNYLRRVSASVTSVEGRPTLLGLLGAILIAFGGLGAGSARVHDPLLEWAHLSWLRFGHGLVLSSLLLWSGVAMMVVAWLWLGRSLIAVQRAGAQRPEELVQRENSLFRVITTIGLWLIPFLVSVPLFSRDAYSYLAQGALLRDGLDPYIAAPVDNPNSLLDNVSSVWTVTTAPYGPAFILVAKFVTMLVGNHVVAGTVVLRLCMLPGLVLLIWGVNRVARHFGANSAVALWICVLNPLVIIHVMGGVHNEMLMVGLMMAGIALIMEHYHIVGLVFIAVAVAVKATAIVVLPFMVWVWMRNLRDRRNYSAIKAFAVASGAVFAILMGVFVLLSWLAGVGWGWLTALSGSAKIINWLTVPTALSNVMNAVGGIVFDINFYALLAVVRMVGLGIILFVLPFLWWRFRHDDREALTGIVWAMVVVVLFVPAALPWYYAWPLAAGAALVNSQRVISFIAGFSTWVMVIFRPDGAHGMYSWIHVMLATACALGAWYWLSQNRTVRLYEYG